VADDTVVRKSPSSAAPVHLRIHRPTCSVRELETIKRILRKGLGNQYRRESDAKGAIDIVKIGGNLSGLVSATSIGSLFIGGNFTGQIIVSEAVANVAIGGSNSGTITITDDDGQTKEERRPRRWKALCLRERPSCIE
jgi:hypothetical protein